MIRLTSNTHDNDKVDILTVENYHQAVWAVVHMDFFHDVNRKIYDELNRGGIVSCVLLTEEEYEELKGRNNE